MRALNGCIARLPRMVISANALPESRDLGDVNQADLVLKYWQESLAPPPVP